MITRCSNLRRGAFTITELLVVITIIVILVLIAVPSFQNMIYSSEEGMAESQMRNAIRAARDVAVRSNGGNDGAAVFFFEPGGRLSILPCVKVGEITDWSDKSAAQSMSSDTTRREIFAAAPGYSAVQLPKYWMVRGYVSANAFTDAWFPGTSVQPNFTTNTDATTKSVRNWVFPETGFFDVDSVNDGFHRSTFMVRFQAGTGMLVGATTEPVLVLAPRNSSVGRTGEPFGNSAYRADRMDDPVRFVRSVLAGSLVGDDKRKLIGRISSDMVLARPVMQLAVYNERKLATTFRARVDPVTESVYVDPSSSSANYQPMYVDTSLNLLDIDYYIEGDTNLDGRVDDNAGADRPEAKLFAIDRQTGMLRPMEVQP